MHFVNKKTHQKPTQLVATPEEQSPNTELSNNSRRLLRYRIINNGEHHVQLGLVAVLLIGLLSSVVLFNHLYPHAMTPGSTRLTASSIMGGIKDLKSVV